MTDIFNRKRFRLIYSHRYDRDKHYLQDRYDTLGEAKAAARAEHEKNGMAFDDWSRHTVQIFDDEAVGNRLICSNVMETTEERQARFGAEDNFFDKLVK